MPLNQSDTIKYDKEHDRVMEGMRSIRDSYAEHQNWSPEDKKKYQQLKKRRGALRKMLQIEY